MTKNRVRAVAPLTRFFTLFTGDEGRTLYHLLQQDTPYFGVKRWVGKFFLFAEATKNFSDPRLSRGSRLLTPIVSFAFLF